MIGKDIDTATQASWGEKSFDAIIPVPLHKSRLRERGFNQAYEIARTVNKERKTPILDCMMRTRATSAQARMGRTGRDENVQGAFAMKKGSASLSQKIVLIIDDVCTTGATIQQVANVLKNAGAEHIFAASFARGWDADIPSKEGN